MFRIVLIEPEIPQNTGNIARLCACAGLTLVLVGKLGFSLEDKYLKRAGMDYWAHTDLVRYASAEEYFRKEPLFFAVSTKGGKRYTDMPVPEVPFDIVFGCESSGLPKFVYESYSDRLYRIPMRESFRSLNLSSSVAAVAYCLLEKKGFPGLI